jgi:hypothetical protein
MTIKALDKRIGELEAMQQPPPIMEFPDYEKSARRQRRYGKVFDLLFRNEGLEGFERRHCESLSKGKHLQSRLFGKRENGERHTFYSDHARFLKIELEAEKVAESLKGRGERIWQEILDERLARSTEVTA